jgi:hypothetical protein
VQSSRRFLNWFWLAMGERLKLLTAKCSVTGWISEKFALNVAQPMFCHNWCLTNTVGKSSTNKLGYFCRFHKTAGSNQTPNRRKSGHPGQMLRQKNVALVLYFQTFLYRFIFDYYIAFVLLQVKSINYFLNTIQLCRWKKINRFKL